VVHHEDDRRLRVDAGETVLVGEPDPHPVQQPRGATGKPVPYPEVGVGVEGGDDLPGVTFDLRHHDVPRDPAFDRVRPGRLEHVRVVHQAVDEDLAFGQGEGADLEVQPFADLVEDDVHAASKEPAGAGKKEAIHGRKGRQQGEDDHNPYRKGHMCAHRHSLPSTDGI
jgi:hypothetical protein